MEIKSLLRRSRGSMTIIDSRGEEIGDKTLGQLVKMQKALSDVSYPTQAKQDSVASRGGFPYFDHPFDKNVLSTALGVSSYHARACKTRAKYIIGDSYTIKEKGESTDPENVIEFVDSLSYRGMDHTKSGRESMFDMSWSGDGWGEIMMDKAGRPSRLRYMATTEMYEGTDGISYIQVENTKRYTTSTRYIKYGLWDEWNDARLENPDITMAYHLYDDNHISRRYGVPLILYGGWDSIVLTGYVNTFYKMLFVNRAIPDFIIMIEGAKPNTKEQSVKQQIVDYMRDKVKGVDNSHKGVVLESPMPGVKIQYIPLNAQHDFNSYLQLKRDAKYDIVTADQILPAKAGIIEQGNLNGESTYEQLSDFYFDISLDRQNWDTFMSKLINDRFGTPGKYEYQSVMSKYRTLQQAQIDASDVQFGIKSINQVATALGNEPFDDPDADVPLPLLNAQASMYSLGESFVEKKLKRMKDSNQTDLF